MILCTSVHHKPPTSGMYLHVLQSCFSGDDQKITFLKENSVLGLQFCVQDRPQIGILYLNPSVIYITGSLNHACDTGSLLVEP